MIKVLVVDDSAFMRVAISKMLQTDPEIYVYDTASNGVQAIKKMSAMLPDVVTMDVEMPQMDGIATLEEMGRRDLQVPVLMLSSITAEGAAVTMDALEKGAIDFICKPSRYASLDVMNLKDELIAKIKSIGRKYKSGVSPLIKVKPVVTPQEKELDAIKPGHGKDSVLAIGTSTGGPKALYSIVPGFPKNLTCPIFIVQHMPAGFTLSLAQHLDRLCELSVKEAEDGETVRESTVYIAPGSQQMEVVADVGGGHIIRITPKRSDILHNPSVDVMMLSVAQEYRNRTVGVVMTGMGADGALGMKDIHERGGKTIAEAEETCVVYGMPRAVVEATQVDHVVPLYDIVKTILNTV